MVKSPEGSEKKSSLEKMLKTTTRTRRIGSREQKPAPVHQRRTFNNQAAHLLRENHSTVTYGSELGRKDYTPKLRKRDKPGNIMIYEDEDQGAEGNATRKTAELPSNTRVEDMDCVQNLLSLSQGNWR